MWGLRLAICQPLDQYANVRPTRILPGITSPLRHVSGPELDWVIVRENSEGEYAGVGGRVHKGQPQEVATDVTMFTRAGVARIIRFAFETARSRPRKLLTVVTKSNAQRHGMVMWDEIAAEVAEEFPDVSWDKMLVDAMTMRMTLKPQTLDTIVATNLHADILSDLAAALAGSLGIAPTANLNPERTTPSMFEPIHGSAFDITGKGIANPVATFWTGAMMLEHLGEKPAADRLMRAVERVTADPGLHTPDLGGKATTTAGHRRRLRGLAFRQRLRGRLTPASTRRDQGGHTMRRTLMAAAIALTFGPAGERLRAGELPPAADHHGRALRRRRHDGCRRPDRVRAHVPHPGPADRGRERDRRRRDGRRHPRRQGGARRLHDPDGQSRHAGRERRPLPEARLRSRAPTSSRS